MYVISFFREYLGEGFNVLGIFFGVTYGSSFCKYDSINYSVKVIEYFYIVGYFKLDFYGILYFF